MRFLRNAAFSLVVIALLSAVLFIGWIFLPVKNTDSVTLIPAKYFILAQVNIKDGLNITSREFSKGVDSFNPGFLKAVLIKAVLRFLNPAQVTICIFPGSSGYGTAYVIKSVRLAKVLRAADFFSRGLAFKKYQVVFSGDTVLLVRRKGFDPDLIENYLPPVSVDKGAPMAFDTLPDNAEVVFFIDNASGAFTDYVNYFAKKSTYDILASARYIRKMQGAITLKGADSASIDIDVAAKVEPGVEKIREDFDFLLQIIRRSCYANKMVFSYAQDTDNLTYKIRAKIDRLGMLIKKFLVNNGGKNV